MTADHGEGLGEHGEKTHGVLVHDATLRVPLVIRAAGLHVAGRIEAPVSLIDVVRSRAEVLSHAARRTYGRATRSILRGEASP